MTHSSSVLRKFLLKTVQVEAHEVQAMLWSFGYFFFLLCGYYIIRPVRDTMGILGGVKQLHWLFTATLIVMTLVVPLFGWISTRFPRRQFLPYVYGFFIVLLLIFYALMLSGINQVYTARAFFVFVSVYNLFVVSVFWSFMTDLYNNTQAKRLFGFIAAGGSIGALTGPLLSSFLTTLIGMNHLPVVTAIFLVMAIVCIGRLSHWAERNTEVTDVSMKNSEEKIKGSIWDGLLLVGRSPYLLGICLLMLLFTSLATFLYMMQAKIVSASFPDPNQQTIVFGYIDAAVNGLTLLLQVFLTSRIIRWLGLSITLALVPLGLALGFGALSIAPVFVVFVAVQVIRRAGNYAIMRPGREMLYVVLTREEKYKAKNFIDTVIYRGGDAISAWVYAGMRSLGLGLSGIALIAAPVALIWAWIAYSLGHKQQQLAAKVHADTEEHHEKDTPT